MQAVEAVVFDIGKVLIEWDPEGFFDSAIGPAARRRLFAEVDLYAMNHRIDLGDGFHDTVAACAAAHPVWAEAIMLWHDRWPEMVPGPIPGSVALLRALRRCGVPVLALSNFGTEPLALARRRFDFLSEFDAAFVSGDLRLAKPDPAIYARLEADTGLPAGGLLFADDRPENVAAANLRGWQTHLFTGPGAWARTLVAAGCLNEQEAIT